MTAVLPAPPAPPGLPDQPPPVRAEAPATSRRLLWVVTALIVVQVFMQQPGQLVHDTRFDLALEPLTFISRVWDVWDPLGDMGRLRNQGVGYLFPMAPFFALGELLAIPGWVVTRLWIALVMVVALWGFARLVDVMGIGEPMGRFIASVAYVVSPLLISRAGNTSWFVIGAALAPWCLLPLVKASRGGPIRRRAAASGLAVMCTGGINAAITLGMLGIPALWLLTRERGPRRRRLGAWWIAAVVAATYWWVLPLVIQGGYGYNFLPVTERAYVTTAFGSPFEAVRGLGDWLSYTSFVRTPLPSGFSLANDSLAIFGSAAIAAVGIFGLARRDLPHRRFLVLTFMVGVAIIGAGYGGTLGNPLAPFVDRLLDGPLGPVRSIFKFQPMVLLPLVLGFAHGATIVLRWLDGRRARWARGAGVAALILMLIASASPVIRGELVNDDAVDAVPSWWTETADFVADAPGRVLVVPGVSQADFTWGYTGEEPMQWLSEVPWATRNIVPQGSTSATTVLDTIERTISAGGDPALDEYLAVNGFSTVVVRNDTKWQEYGAPSPQAVNSAVRASGLELQESFGPAVPGATDPLTPDLELSQIEVYSVPAFTSDGLARSFPTSTAAVVTGDSGSALRLEQYGLADRALITAQDADPADLPDEWIITDSNRRRYVSFGLNRANGSYVLTPTEGGPNGQPLERGLLPGTVLSSQTTAARTGVREVTASSYGSIFVPVPEAAPSRAVDGDPRTAWVSGAGLDGEGQWIELELDEPVDVGSIDVEILDDGPWRTRVEEIQVITDAGNLATRTQAGEGTQALSMPAGPTSRIRLVFSEVQPRPGGSAAPGIREIRIPGLAVDQRLAVPTEFIAQFAGGSGPLPTYVLQRSTVSPFSILRRDEERSLRRQVLVPAEGALGLAATVAPQPSEALLDAIDTTPTFAIDASSTLANLPRFAARNLVDADPDTVWIGARPPDTENPGFARDVVAAESSAPWQSLDERPVISMAWSEPRVVSELRVTPVAGYSSPVSVLIQSGSEQREAEIDGFGFARFDPLLTDSIEVSFPRIARYVIGESRFGPQVRPIALQALVPNGVEDLLPGPLDDAEPVTVPCEEGPVVRVGDIERRLALESSARDIVELQPIAAEVCDLDPIPVVAGQLQVDAINDDGAFAVRSVVLRDPTRPGGVGGLDGSGDATPVRSTEIQSWGRVDRTVRIASGAEAYLAVQENVNSGWQASLDGQRLEPITLFGWQQGFIVPAGTGGDIELHFAPSDTFRLSLLVGGLLVVVLVLAALPFGRGNPSPAIGEARWARWVDGGIITVAAIVIGGLVAPFVWFAWWVARWRWRLAATVAGAAFLSAGVLVALNQAMLSSRLLDAFGVITTVLALVAIFFVVANLLSSTPADDDAATPPSGTAGNDDA